MQIEPLYRCLHCETKFADPEYSCWGNDCCPACGYEGLADIACNHCAEAEATCDDWCPQCFISIQLSEGTEPNVSAWGFNASDYLEQRESAA